MRVKMRHAKNATGASSGSRKFNAAGKVVLAAIVHHDTIPILSTNGHPLNMNEANNAADDQQEKPIKRTKNCKNNNKKEEKQPGNRPTTGNTYEDDKSLSSSRRKLSKLFSKKKQQATTNVTKTTTTTLIDNAKSNEYLASNEKVILLDQPPKCVQDELTSNSNRSLLHQSPHHHNHLEHRTNHTSCDNHNSNRNRDEQVIEFKFDLIVDQADDQGTGMRWNCATDFSDSHHLAGCDATDEPNSVGLDGQRGGNVMKLKLNDNVNELVESFVLDSNDVCLMSIGEQRADLNIGYHCKAHQQQQKYSNKQEQQLKGPKEVEEFEHLSQLAAHTLAYSFHLLESSGQRRTAASGNGSSKTSVGQQSSSSDVELMSLESARNLVAVANEPQRRGGEPTSSIAANNYSIELSATLFLSDERRPDNEETPIGAISAEPPINIDTGHSHHASEHERLAPPTQQQQLRGCFSIIDLLARDGAPVVAGTMNGGGRQGLDTDNGSRWDDDDERRRALTKGSASSSNTIDCSTVEEALATIDRIRLELRQLQGGGGLMTGKKTLIIGLKLKQRINGGVFSNRMCLIDFRPKLYELQPIFESIFNGQALAHLKRQKIHLQSLESGLNSSLSDDELIKQHHQVASQNKLIQAEWLLYKQLSSALIRTLLIVHVHKLVSPVHQLINHTTNIQELEMQTSLEHKLMADNLVLLEFARSIQRASCTRLRRRKRHLRSHLASSDASVASNISATTTTNELLSSPLRFNSNKQPSPMSHRSHANKLTYGSRDTGSYNRKASLDMNLALSRHHHRHHNHHHYRHWQPTSHHHNSSTGHHQANRCHTLQRQSDFTESSSISTSSGSQRTQQIRSARSSRTANNSYRKRDNCCNLSSLNNLSDSDSVTSANLNSCSSSSYNRLTTSGQQQQWRSNHVSKDAVELRWLAKQSKMMTKRGLELSSPSSPPIELSSLKCLAAQRSSSISRVGRDRSRLGKGMEDTVMAARASSVIQIDCYPTNSRQRASNLVLSGLETQNKTIVMQMGDETMTDNTMCLDDNTDNVSDICSVIAEPPKQLKLEEFLNQLSSIIAAPIATTNSLGELSGHPVDDAEANERTSQVPLSGRKEITSDVNEVTNTIMCPDGYDSDGMLKTTNCPTDGSRQGDILLKATRSNNGNGIVADEDDEDCKSHSSILEHLSSLALESNTKLNNRQLQLDYHQSHHHLCNFTLRTHNDQQNEVILQTPNDYPHTFLVDKTADPELNVHDHSEGNNRTGHLQRLLNSSAQFRKTTRTKVANTLVNVIDPSSSIEDQLGALSLTSPYSAFISSNESSCSSSSASAAAVNSSANDDKITDLSKMKPSMIHASSARKTSKRDLYPRNYNLKV